MGLFEGKTPAERNKMLAALALPALALLFIVRMLFFSSGPARPQTNANSNNNRRANTTSVRAPAPQNPAEAEAADDLLLSRRVSWQPPAPAGHEAGRNIFAFYVPPPPPPKPVAPEAPATPTPTPPLLLAGLSPPQVYARTGNFTLQISGDKFTPTSRVYLDGQEQPTQYRSAQQLTANVPAALIAAPGARQVTVRTPDGLFSNDASLNVMQPPAPTYTYIGLLRRLSYETAVLKDQRGELYSVRAGDIVEGRFRVTGINERGVEVVDKDLNIKHTMPFVESRSAGGAVGRVPGAIQPPPPPPPEEDGNTGNENPEEEP